MGHFPEEQLCETSVFFIDGKDVTAILPSPGL
jgi:hypothetical protein